MTETVEGVHPSADPPPPAASLTAISIKVRSRRGEKPSMAAPPARKSGDLTRHLAREAAKVPAVEAPEPPQPQAEPEPPAAFAADMPETQTTVPESAPFDAAPAIPAAEVCPIVAAPSEPAEEPILELRKEAIVDPPFEFAPAETAAGDLEAASDTIIAPIAETATAEALEFETDTGIAPVVEPATAEIPEVETEAGIARVAEPATAEVPEVETDTGIAPVAEPATAEVPEVETHTTINAPAEETSPAAPALSIVHSAGEVSNQEPPSSPAANAPDMPPARIEPSAPEFADIAAYWRSLCGELVYPTVSAVDRDFVAQRWPGTLMIAFARTPGYPNRHPSIGGVARLGTATATLQDAIDSGSYAVEWMIEVGRAALAAAAPLEELQRLPTRDGNIAFRLLALPLGAPDAEPDTVLCHLAPATAAPRFGKRRNWLAA